MPKVRFVNELVTVEVPSGTSLRDAAIQARIEIYRGMWTHLNCRGNGICGRCKVWILSPSSPTTLRERAHRVQGLQRLACQVRIDGELDVRTRPLGPATVQVPEGSWTPAYLAEAEKRLAAAREEAKREAEKKAKEAAKPKPEAKPKAEKPAEAKPDAPAPETPAAAAPAPAPAPAAESPSEAKPT